MSINPTTSAPNPPLFFYDCEVDHKEIDLANVTEVCVSKDSSYFTGYMSKSEHANYDGPYLKPIPSNKKRYDFNTVLGKMISFIHKNTPFGSPAILMGYNVIGWDEPVLWNNFNRFGMETSPLTRWKFFDIAKVAHSLGFPMGTTQQQLEVALCLKNLPANRHRAHADVKVVKEIWKKMSSKIAENQEALNKVNKAFLQEAGAEEAVAEILKEYDPSLVPSEEVLNVIQRIKDSEKLKRKDIVVLFDVESTGLFAEMDKAKASSHNIAPRIVEFAAKILSPYKDDPSCQNELFSSLVDPHIPIPEEVSKIHGIVTKDVEGQPSISGVWTMFESWVRTTNTFKRMLSENSEKGYAEPRIILAGYNNFRYDNPLLQQELLTAGVDLKRELDKGVKSSWDVLPLMSTWYTGLPADKKPPKNTLQAHARFLGIPENQAHRALADVETLEQVLYKICAPVDPSPIIIEAVSEKINLSSPGIGLKTIIQETQSRVKAQETEESAIKHAVESYLEHAREQKQEKETDEPKVKRRKKETAPLNPSSQDFLIGSLDPYAPLALGLEGSQKTTYI